MESKKPAAAAAAPTPAPAPRQRRARAGTRAGACARATTAGGAAAVENLIAMGFPRDQALAALQAAFGNADRAVEYLFNGIPDELLADEAADEARPPARRAGSAWAARAAGRAGIHDGFHRRGARRGDAPQTPMQRMLAEPQMVQLITMARQNPALVQPLLEARAPTRRCCSSSRPGRFHGAPKRLRAAATAGAPPPAAPPAYRPARAAAACRRRPARADPGDAGGHRPARAMGFPREAFAGLYRVRQGREPGGQLPLRHGAASRGRASPHTRWGL